MSLTNTDTNQNCRLCLKALHFNDYLNIFGPYSQNLSIAAAVSALAQIEVTTLDCFSKSICLNCMENLRDAYEFRAVIIASDNQLRTPPNMRIKTEICEDDSFVRTIKIDPDHLDKAFSENQEESEDSGDERAFINIKSEINDDEDIGNVESSGDEAFVDRKAGKNGGNRLGNVRKGPAGRVKNIKQFSGRSRVEEDPLKSEEIEIGETKLASVLIESKEVAEKQERGAKDFYCEQCDKKFTNASIFQLHTMGHAEGKTFQCDSCGKLFRTREGVVKHKRRHRGLFQKKFICEFCNRAFERQAALNIHRRRHTGEKPFKCETCGRSFVDSVTLTNHKATHGSRPGLSCSICNKIITNERNLRQHMKDIHINVRSFRCTICNKELKTKNILSKHMKIHNGVKPWQCDICKKEFRHKSAWKKHEGVHSRDLSKKESFPCTVCGKLFAYKARIISHMKTKHPGLEVETGLGESQIKSELITS